MKIAYFDCFAGASGDMILGALMDAGLSLEQLKGELAKLPVTGYDLRVESVARKGIAGSQAFVITEAHTQPRHLHDIQHMIESSRLDTLVKKRSLDIFRRLAEAEAKVHRIGVEQIHFHEVGAVDAIVDIVGAVAGSAVLGIEKIWCSPLNLGAGMVECAHGTLPVPAPATAELIRGFPVYSTGLAGELVTPTGAAILTTLAAEFGPMPAMIPAAIGYGAGSHDRDVPNMLRVVIGEASGSPHCGDRVAVGETNVDDMNPQIYDHIMRNLLHRGALDVFLVSAQMKKNRPGTLLTVICAPERIAEFSDFLMKETTTIGIRWRIDSRVKADRSIEEIQTEYGPVKIKTATVNEKIVNVAPEYEDCRRLASETGKPLKEILESVRASGMRIFRHLGEDA